MKKESWVKYDLITCVLIDYSFIKYFNIHSLPNNFATVHSHQHKMKVPFAL